MGLAQRDLNGEEYSAHPVVCQHQLVHCSVRLKLVPTEVVSLLEVRFVASSQGKNFSVAYERNTADIYALHPPLDHPGVSSGNMISRFGYETHAVCTSQIDEQPSHLRRERSRKSCTI